MINKIKAIGMRGIKGAVVWADDRGRIDLKDTPMVWLFPSPLHSKHGTFKGEGDREAYAYTAGAENILRAFKNTGVAIQVDQTKRPGSPGWYAEVYATCEAPQKLHGKTAYMEAQQKLREAEAELLAIKAGGTFVPDKPDTVTTFKKARDAMNDFGGAVNAQISPTGRFIKAEPELQNIKPASQFLAQGEMAHKIAEAMVHDALAQGAKQVHDEFIFHGSVEDALRDMGWSNVKRNGKTITGDDTANFMQSANRPLGDGITGNEAPETLAQKRTKPYRFAALKKAIKAMPARTGPVTVEVPFSVYDNFMRGAVREAVAESDARQKEITRLREKHQRATRWCEMFKHEANGTGITHPELMDAYQAVTEDFETLTQKHAAREAEWQAKDMKWRDMHANEVKLRVAAEQHLAAAKRQHEINLNTAMGDEEIKSAEVDAWRAQLTQAEGYRKGDAKAIRALAADRDKLARELVTARKEIADYKDDMAKAAQHGYVNVALREVNAELQEQVDVLNTLAVSRVAQEALQSNLTVTESRLADISRKYIETSNVKTKLGRQLYAVADVLGLPKNADNTRNTQVIMSCADEVKKLKHANKLLSMSIDTHNKRLRDALSISESTKQVIDSGTTVHMDVPKGMGKS